METVEVPQESKKKFWKTPIFFIAVTLIVGLAGGFGIGRYATPPEIQVETKTKTVMQMPAQCQNSLVTLTTAFNKYRDLHSTLNSYIEGLMGSTDWDMPVVIATKTYQEKELMDYSEQYDAEYKLCEPFLLTQ